MKIHSKKYFAFIGAVLAVLFFLPMLTVAGDLEPTAAPDNASSAMYTLEDIYNYLDTGVKGTKRSGGFIEPGFGPGATGHTLDEIHEKVAETCFETCEGTLNGTRWCDNGGGTVTDMTTGLIWLQNAYWGGLKPWRSNTPSDYDDAHTRAGILSAAMNAELSDGSVEGDWRLPTKSELYGLANGTEPVRSSSMRAFTGVQSDFYWSSTTYASNTSYAWYVYMYNGYAGIYYHKANHFYVWPVRSDN
jgi:hypothetical protein